MCDVSEHHRSGMQRDGLILLVPERKHLQLRKHSKLRDGVPEPGRHSVDASN